MTVAGRRRFSDLFERCRGSGCVRHHPSAQHVWTTHRMRPVGKVALNDLAKVAVELGAVRAGVLVTQSRKSRVHDLVRVVTQLK